MDSEFQEVVVTLDTMHIVVVVVVVDLDLICAVFDNAFVEKDLMLDMLMQAQSKHVQQQEKREEKREYYYYYPERRKEKLE